MPGVVAPEPALHRVLGQHHVDGKVLADVAQEFEVAERPDPVEVVDAARRRSGRRRNRGTAASASRMPATLRSQLVDARAGCAPRSCRWGRRSCRSRRRRRRSAGAPPAETAAASSAATSCRRAGCRPSDRSRRRASAASASSHADKPGIIGRLMNQAAPAEIVEKHCGLRIADCGCGSAN